MFDWILNDEILSGTYEFVGTSGIPSHTKEVLPKFGKLY